MNENNQKYKYWAKGTLPDGNKFKCEGSFMGPSDPDSSLPPWAAFEMAADIVEKSPLGVRPDTGCGAIQLMKIKGKKK